MAIFSEATRYGGTTTNAFAILENATYLTEEESGVYPADVPVAENSRIGHYTVKFEDIAQLAEANQMDYIDAMLAVAEHNQIEPASLAVVVNEADIIADPQIVMGLANVVVAPVSEHSLAAQYCNAVIDAFQENSDDQFLYDALVEDAALVSFLEGKGDTFKGAGQQAVGAVKMAGGAIANNAKAAYEKGSEAVKKGYEWVKQAVNKGRNWISSKISWLRSLYQNMLRKANQAEQSGKNTGIIGTLKTIATKIANIIDALLEKLAIVTRNSDAEGGAELKAKQDAQSKFINGEKGAKGNQKW